MVPPMLPKAVEYAVKALICLSLSSGRPVSARQVARFVRIPPSQAAKTLHSLSWAGIVRSRRGSAGGYLLRKGPEEIRIKQVMELFKPAAQQEEECSADPICQIWSETCKESEQAWEQLTISELAHRTAAQWQPPESAGEATLAANNKTLNRDMPRSQR